MRNSQISPYRVSGSANLNTLATSKITPEGGRRWKAVCKLLQYVTYHLFHATTSQITKKTHRHKQGESQNRISFSTRDRRQLQGFGLSEHEETPSYTALGSRMTEFC